MSYDYTSAKDFVRWVQKQHDSKNKYQLGGIGRIKSGVRIFDCIGLVKCFLWHDYSQTNARYYNKTAPDKNTEGYFALAKKKGSIATIPEIPGVIVYQRGHVGVYMGNGLVIESTAAWKSKIQKSYFKGKHSGIQKRTTWTHWFMLPQLNYDEPEPEENVQEVENPILSKSIDELAKEVLEGKYGVGQARAEALGSKYAKVQARVNEILKEQREQPKEEPKEDEIKVGDTVKVLKAVQYGTSKPFATYYDTYKVLEVAGNRICIGVGKVITAAVHRKNLKRV